MHYWKHINPIILIIILITLHSLEENPSNVAQLKLNPPSVASFKVLCAAGPWEGVIVSPYVE